MTGRDLPILFSGPMVRALLAGTKTQTRRALNPQPYDFVTDGKRYWNASGQVSGRICISDRALLDLHRKPRFGDRLYVREHWRVSSQYDDHAPAHSKDGKPVLKRCGMTVMFEAGGSIANDRLGRWTPDNAYPPSRPDWAGKFRQGMHMPRWASRLTLTVTEVRVERLQDISRDDAMAEGIVQTWGDFMGDPPEWAVASISRHGDASGSHIYDNRTSAENYRELWNHINGPGAWDANPWVAAYTFTVALGNIDQLARAA